VVTLFSKERERVENLERESERELLFLQFARIEAFQGSFVRSRRGRELQHRKFRTKEFRKLDRRRVEVEIGDDSPFSPILSLSERSRLQT